VYLYTSVVGAGTNPSPTTNSEEKTMKYMQPKNSKEIFKVSEKEAEVLKRCGWQRVTPAEVERFYRAE